MSAERASATRRIAAPAAEIFRVVADPAGHVAIDGSGMLQTAHDARPLTEVGQTFDIRMDREPLGDLPWGRYTVRNTVTRIVPDRLVEWGVGSRDIPPFGHVYGWELTPVGDTETDVTNYCDWSGLPEEVKGQRPWPVVPLEMLERSVENLERLVTGGAAAAG